VKGGAGGERKLISVCSSGAGKEESDGTERSDLSRKPAHRTTGSGFKWGTRNRKLRLLPSGGKAMGNGKARKRLNKIELGGGDKQ